MNKHLLTLLIICLGIFLPQVVLGDTIPTEGTWGKFVSIYLSFTF